MGREEYEKYLDDIKVADDKCWLTKSEEERFNLFRNKDPFPEIQPALLNSADILKYILVTGLISDFCCEDLLGATYKCRVSGEYLCFDKDKKMYSEPANDEKDIKIGPNSITYVAIINVFRIPDYIALRFNLMVKHAYKGLLLGTGPIVDPGFVGQIYIPLHNLTSNTYYIKPGAQLISVEFTKLSAHSSWSADLSDYTKLFDRIRRADYIHKNIIPNRSLYYYIDRALTDDDFYREKDLPKSISSAVADEIRRIQTDVLAQNKAIDDKFGEYQKLHNESTFKIDNEIDQCKAKIKMNISILKNTVYAALKGYKKDINIKCSEMQSKVKDEIMQFKTETTSTNATIKDVRKRTASTENYVRGISVFAIISILVSCIAFSWNAYTYGRDSTVFRDAKSIIEAQREKYEGMKDHYDLSIQELLDRIEALEIMNGKENRTLDSSN
ncbi:MAG: hypothetical protein LBL79_02395 [Prevotella sp.]|jgi:deoxycytidine triphosphate deaminase|nr:hypothetical protein [Prevotella sp.]